MRRLGKLAEPNDVRVVGSGRELAALRGKQTRRETVAGNNQVILMVCRSGVRKIPTHVAREEGSCG